MTETNIAQTEPVLVAIDIAKARHEVLIAIPDKTRRRRLTVLNQLDDFNRLIATLGVTAVLSAWRLKPRAITTVLWLIIWPPQVLR